MATALHELLSKLILSDYDAIEAYEAAIERLTGPDDKRQLERFRDDHRRHISELSELDRHMGSIPPKAPDLKRIVAKGKVLLGGLIGDEAILRAMKSNEDGTNEAYESASVNVETLPAEVRHAIIRGLDDERRHLEWIERRIGMSTPDPVIDPDFIRGV